MNQFWYELPEYAKHGAIFAHVTALDEEQSALRENNLAYAQLYSNRVEPGLGANVRGAVRDPEQSITRNIIRSAVDTADSLIGKSRPKVTVLTDGADWELQRLATQVEQYLEGLFRYGDVYTKMSLVFRDACVFGTGCLGIFAHSGDVCFERVLIDEIIVDEQEVPTGGLPRQLHRIRYVSRDKLIAKYSTKAEDIKRSHAERRTGTGNTTARRVDPDMVLLCESYYLSPGPGKAGLYVASVDTATLEEKAWTGERYPYTFYYWSPPLTGFYGQGIAEVGIGHQIRLNELEDFKRRCHDLVAIPRVAAQTGTQVGEINNEIGQFIYYTDKPPVFFTPQALNPEIYAEADRIEAALFKDLGLSEMARSASRPEGIEAGVALQQLTDNQSQRLSSNQQRWESAFMDVGQLAIDAVRSLGESAPKMYLSSQIVEEIDWPAADFDKLKFVLHIAPSSIMSLTPSGRIQKVIELAQYGVPLSPDVMVRLLGHPDIKLEDTRMKSALEDAEWTISCLRKGRYESPEAAFQDLGLVVGRVTAAYLDDRRNGAPEHVLELERQWIKSAREEMAKAAPPPMPGPPGVSMPAAGLGNSGLPGLVAA